MGAKILFLLALALSSPAVVYSQQTATAPAPASAIKAERYYRTELYMGRSIPGGAMVSEDAWEKFLNDVVTPRFPDGFTVLSGRGQYREASGTIAREPSQVLVFLYRKADRKTAGAKIEEIRLEYKKQFRQESVMRMDMRSSVNVLF